MHGGVREIHPAYSQPHPKREDDGGGVPSIQGRVNPLTEQRDRGAYDETCGEHCNEANACTGQHPTWLRQRCHSAIAVHALHAARRQKE